MLLKNKRPANCYPRIHLNNLDPTPLHTPLLSATLSSATEGNVIKQHDPVGLGELEREILELIWTRGRSTADDLRELLARRPKESTVRTVLLRLEKKGYLAHDVEGRTFVYRPLQSRETVTARAVKRVAEWFCSGSMKELMVGMVDAKALSRKEVEELRERLERSAKEMRG